ncbi:hypothetical protein BHE97_13610 [Aeromicrobium sp. PE09-221]|uniref:hypothetical protein n=1 Tax=Aeromicrobium sp. PE09-221 TaxID=1898043 RepID=UPI000B3E47D2|nr:hypothetical protein [Aeromicrobium sp. PE09-221]OUZ08264.1 hypothetical protein BHE97_13610 [Aeromicrobium sp. PE09-221]
MSEPDTGPSWDVDRRDAPPRPSVATDFAPEPPIERPRRVAIAMWLVFVAAVIFVGLTVLAGLRLGEVREAVTAALPSDLEEDYTASEIRRAVRVLIGAVAGLGLLLTVMQVLAIVSVAKRRNTTARVLFITVLVLYLPVAAVGPSVRSFGAYDTALSGLAVASLLVAMILICTPAVTRWWRQPDRRGPLPLLRPEDGLDIAPEGQRPGEGADTDPPINRS